MTELVDTHCHLEMDAFDPDREEVLERATSQGVVRLVTVGTDENSSRAASDLALGHAARGIFATVGVHPHEASTVEKGLPESLKALAARDRVVAVGETGLDFFYDHSPRDVQRQVFALHVAWACEVCKPLVVHVRDAYDEALEILRREGAHRCGGVIHCFSGTWEQGAEALDLGFYLSFAGPLTFPKSTALREVGARVPLDRLLCETDAPYLAPHPFRGKRNEPAHVARVYERLAEVRRVDQGDLEAAVFRNAEALFHFSGRDVSCGGR